MAIKNTIRQRPPAIPKPKDLPPGSQEWARWVSERMRELQNKSGIVQKNVLVLGKDKNAVLNLTQRQGNSIRDAQGRITEAEEELALAQERLDQAREDLDELNDVTLPALETELGENSFEIEQLQGRLNDVDGELDSLQSDLSGLDAELLANSQAIDSLDGRMDGVDTELQGLDSALGALDTQLQNGISNLQGQIDDIILDGAGGVSIVYSVNDPSGTDWKEGSTWFKWNSPSSRRIIGQWNFNGTTWESVMLADQVIANLDAGKITTGFINAGRIGANSITANKLAISGFDNFFNNAPFEMLDPLGWTTDGTISFSDWSRESVTVTPHVSSVTRIFLGERSPVKQGDQIDVELNITRPTGSTGNVALYIRRINAAGTAANTVVGTLSPTDNGLQTSYTIPANTYFAQFYLYTTGASPYELRPSFIRRKTGATLIEDGAVTTDKVAADAITGQKILAGSITAAHGVFATGAIQNADIGNLNASKINAGTLAAARIASGSITGDKIQANSITAAHGVFATGAIQNADIGNLNASKINAGTLAAARIAGGSITGEKLAANAITTRELTSDNITGLNIVGSTITGTTIVGADITGTNTLTGGSLNVVNGSITIDSQSAGVILEASRNGVPTLVAYDNRVELGSSATTRVRAFLEATGAQQSTSSIKLGQVVLSQTTNQPLDSIVLESSYGSPSDNYNRPAAVMWYVVAKNGLYTDGGLQFRAGSGLTDGLTPVATGSAGYGLPLWGPDRYSTHQTRFNNSVFFAPVEGNRGLSSSITLNSSSGVINFNSWNGGFSGVVAASGGIRVGRPGTYAIDVVMTISGASGSIAGCVLVNGVERAPSQISYDLGTIRRLHYTIHTTLSANDLVQLEKRNAGTGTLTTNSFLAVTRVNT